MINGTLLENKKEDLIMEQEKKYYKYRYNPACPNCKEEHIYYIVLISEEDQKFMDDYYKAHQEESS